MARAPFGTLFDNGQHIALNVAQQDFTPHLRVKIDVSFGDIVGAQGELRPALAQRCQRVIASVDFQELPIGRDMSVGIILERGIGEGKGPAKPLSRLPLCDPLLEIDVIAPIGGADGPHAVPAHCRCARARQAQDALREIPLPLVASDMGVGDGKGPDLRRCRFNDDGAGQRDQLLGDRNLAFHTPAHQGQKQQ